MQGCGLVFFRLCCVGERAHLRPTERRRVWLFPRNLSVISLSRSQVQPMVLLKHHQQFEEWHNRWLEENVTMEAVDVVQDWLMGDEDEEMVPCKTTCETVNVHGVPVNRYRVQYSRRPASP